MPFLSKNQKETAPLFFATDLHGHIHESQSVAKLVRRPVSTRAANTERGSCAVVRQVSRTARSGGTRGPAGEQVIHRKEEADYLSRQEQPLCMHGWIEMNVKDLIHSM